MDRGVKCGRWRRCAHRQTILREMLSRKSTGLQPSSIKSDAGTTQRARPPRRAPGARQWEVASRADQCGWGLTQQRSARNIIRRSPGA